MTSLLANEWSLCGPKAPRLAELARLQSFSRDRGCCTPSAGRWGSWDLGYPQIWPRHLCASNRPSPPLCENGKILAGSEGVKYLHPLPLLLFPPPLCEAQGVAGGHINARQQEGAAPTPAGVAPLLECIWRSLVSTKAGKGHSSISSSEISVCTFFIRFLLQTSKKLNQAPQ